MNPQRLRDFLATETSGAILLAGAALTALIWINSPFGDSYVDLWSHHIAVSFAGVDIDLSLQHWINDGLMTIFFLVVGLEIKREIRDGHLSKRRDAMLPLAAAIGGMLVPAALYMAIAGSTAPRGWAIPMATDIALAVGIVAVVGTRIPSSLRAFLLGLAIVDDIGAIIVIAVVYSTGINFGWLAAAGIAALAVVVVRMLGLRIAALYILSGLVLWYSLYKAGIHPSIAGVALGLLAPTTQHKDTDQTTIEWLEHLIHPWSSYVIVPLFALANSGIKITGDSLSAAVRSPITWGIIVGLVVGKPLGVVLASRISARSGIADMPAGSTSRHIIGIGTTAGIGFTVALFITELAFTDAAQQDQAKLAILFASLLAAAISYALLSHRHQDVGQIDARSV
jgi:NhaA family Na+:H+ antiporter